MHQWLNRVKYLIKVKEQLLNDLSIKNSEIGIMKNQIRENEKRLEFLCQLEKKLRELEDNHKIIENQCTTYMNEIRISKNENDEYLTNSADMRVVNSWNKRAKQITKPVS